MAPGGFFDRTLMVKTNMQLSTDAMRKSLEADWSLLTDEMKSLIIESSFRERMADDRMLQKIKSKENSSRCSCGQSAPPEYEAEASCCARGTELVFTWRKNGDFEVSQCCCRIPFILLIANTSLPFKRYDWMDV